jgi:hypothetical protein
MLTEGNPALPFGGVKESGFGRYKGGHGLHAFSNVKSVLVDKDSPQDQERTGFPTRREVSPLQRSDRAPVQRRHRALTFASSSPV